MKERRPNIVAAAGSSLMEQKLKPSETAAQYIGYLSFSPSERSDKFTTSLAWLRHAARVNQTGIEALLRRLCPHSSLVDPGCMPQPSQ